MTFDIFCAIWTLRYVVDALCIGSCVVEVSSLTLIRFCVLREGPLILLLYFYYYYYQYIFCFWYKKRSVVSILTNNRNEGLPSNSFIMQNHPRNLLYLSHLNGPNDWRGSLPSQMFSHFHPYVVDQISNEVQKFKWADQLWSVEESRGCYKCKTLTWTRKQSVVSLSFTYYTQSAVTRWSFFFSFFFPEFSFISGCCGWLMVRTCTIWCPFTNEVKQMEQKWVVEGSMIR